MADYISQFTGGEIDARLRKVSELEAEKQDALVSGENIKTVGGQSVLGSGDIPVGDENAVKFTPQTLTDAQKAQALANIGAASLEDVANMDFVIVTSLPTASASTMGHIYLVGPDANDNYDRYVTKLDGGSYSWVTLGSTQIDLSDYATKAEVDELEAKVDDLLDVKERSLDISTTITPASLGTLYYTDYEDAVMKANTTYSVKIKASQAIGQTNIDVTFREKNSNTYNQRYRSGTTDLSQEVEISVTPTADIYRIGVYQSGGTTGFPFTFTIPGGTAVVSRRLDTIEQNIDELGEDIEETNLSLEESIQNKDVEEQNLTCAGLSFIRRDVPIMLTGVKYTIKFKATADFGQSRFNLTAGGKAVKNSLSDPSITERALIHQYGNEDLSQEQTLEYTPVWDVYAIGCSSYGTIEDSTPLVTYRIYRFESEVFYDIDKDMDSLVGASANDYFKLGACRCVDYGKVANPAIGIITMGQSNADGRIPAADFPASVTLPDETEVPVSASIERCKFIYGENSTNNYGANAEKNFADYSNSGKWGFDQIVYNLVNNAIGGSHDFYVAKQTFGGTPLLNDSPEPGTFYPDIAKTGTKISETLHATILIRRAMELNPSIKWRAILWNQGTADSSTTSYDDYYKALKNLIYYLRGVVGNPRLPFVFCSVPTNSGGYSVIVTDAQKRIAADVNDTYFIEMGDASEFLPDSTHMHYGADDAEKLGIDMYEIMKNAGCLKPYEDPDE